MSVPRPHRRRCLVVLVSLLAAILVPDSASAARTVYGGEVKGARGGLFALQLEPGDVLDLGFIAFDTAVPCPGFSRGLSIGDALPLVSARIRLQGNGLYSGPVSADGEWDASGFITYGFGRYDVEIDETFRGTVVGAKMSGTFRARTKIYGRNGKLAFRCQTVRRRWTARSAPGRIFAGATQQNMPVVIEVADDGATVRRVGVSGWSLCRNGVEVPTTGSWRDLAIDSAGVFESSRPFAYRDDGVRYRGHERLHATIEGPTVRGRTSGHWRERRPSGKTLRCASGVVRFRALSSPLP
jgi:hypothetical protein